MVEFCKRNYQNSATTPLSAEMYQVVGNPDHTETCGECRACGVVKTVIEDTVNQLAVWMSEDEFFLFAGIIETVRERREQAKGR